MFSYLSVVLDRLPYAQSIIPDFTIFYPICSGAVEPIIALLKGWDLMITKEREKLNYQFASDRSELLHSNIKPKTQVGTTGIVG